MEVDMPKQFIWLIDSQSPRKGPALIKGEAHNAADYSADVVEYWIESDVAKWVETKSKKKEKD
jgi:hypothetical protein